MKTQLDIASQFLGFGISVFPVIYRDKRPEVSVWKHFQKQLPTVEQVRNWFFGGFHNVAVVTGWQGLIVIDFDDADEYEIWLRWCARRGGVAARIAKRAYRVQSSRGMHVYLRLPEALKTIKVRNADGSARVDVKGQGGYVLGATSVHPSGAVYTALRQELVFPMVRALSDVLPADLLTQTELPANMQAPRPRAPLSGDPWESADQAQTVPANAVERIKTALRMESFFAQYHPTGVEYFMTQCPFHDDEHPSFWFDAGRQICGCFSGCTPKALDVIGLYARLHGLSNTEAIRLLARTL
jgi:hypothetical protein